MKREQIEIVLGRNVTDDEWLVACELLEFIERHPAAEATLDHCIERGLSAEQA